MFKSFASAIALLAIGAHASDEEKPTAAGGVSSKATYKYGRFVASMKASRAMGTGSAFFLYDNEDFAADDDVFDNWNAMTIVPSLGQKVGQDEEGAVL
jgi:beta-glucanase (GH16 family)